MSKKTEEKKEVIVNANEFAVGLFYDETNQHWNFVKVAYDPVAKVATTVTMEDAGPSKDNAVGMLKIFNGRFFL